MNYIELTEKLQKTLDILNNKQWLDSKKLEQTAINLISDFWKYNELPISKIEAGQIDFLPTDFPDDLKCLFTYQFVFKSDKRKPGGHSDLLTQVILKPELDEKLWLLETEQLFAHINHHTAILRSQQMLLEEQSQLQRKLNRVNEELLIIQESLKKY